MDGLIINRVEANSDGYTLIVAGKDRPRCKSCLKEIPPGHEFYYCRKENKFWCYKHRVEDWNPCDMLDGHEHLHITRIQEVVR